ncbi:hypothetical protein EV356DRAFT_535351 [Viridothelium virens]|uniref:Uncharacterized protein n=1 Tax=Viridothelium virens TaxID=1048519 RepID=A0A6A6H1C0_VIRVR|nr:hypothetical protein EV356DRAFT_535351 [Viridothelium virens]
MTWHDEFCVAGRAPSLAVGLVHMMSIGAIQLLDCIILSTRLSSIDSSMKAGMQSLQYLIPKSAALSKDKASRTDPGHLKDNKLGHRMDLVWNVGSSFNYLHGVSNLSSTVEKIKAKAIEDNRK